jgi:hypothetical protein
MDPSRFDHPAFRTAAGMLAGYSIILLVMTVLLFLIPYAIFVAL